MRKQMSISRLALAVSGAALAFGAMPAQAQPNAVGEPIIAFAPSPQPGTGSIDYSLWTEAMKNLVVSMGPSLRETAGTRQPGFGSRRIWGHTSRYRLEGTRIMFSFLDQDVIATFGEYRRDLEATADKVDIQSLSRNEQLAYWINLHNVALVEQIANAWPIRRPREFEIDGVPLDEAKFITVEGVKLSPRDIRTRIVYPNWRDPNVIYGFWRGEIGGPSIPSEAFNSQNLLRLLDRGATDFVNSLRGTQKLGDTLQVSTLYAEAAPFYFPNFEADLRAHLAAHASEDVEELLATTDQIEAVIEEPDIADLAGGRREPNLNFVSTNGISQSFRIPQSMAQLLSQRERKFERLRREERGVTVTFEPLNLPGDEKDKNEIE